MKYKKKIKYEGLGFVELIISIGVAGIALMVLMNMAANSMNESIRYERQDALTRLATNGALVLRKHVEDANHPDIDVDFGGNPGCYEIDFDNSRVLFTSTPYGFDSLENVESLERDIIYDNSDEDNIIGDLFYVAYCVDRIENSVYTNSDVYIGRVVVGYVNCGKCSILPYEHHAIVNVKLNPNRE